MADRYHTRPSLLLGIPPSDDWHAYCVDEAIFTLETGHDHRDKQWEDRFRDDDNGNDLYRRILSDPRTGRPPSSNDLAMLPSAGHLPG